MMNYDVVTLMKRKNSCGDIFGESVFSSFFLFIEVSRLNGTHNEGSSTSQKARFSPPTI